VNRYDIYLRIKATNQVTAGLLSLLEIPRARSNRINIDLATKLPMTKTGNNTIITIVDALTK
jgi:hypothetical protein